MTNIPKPAWIAAGLAVLIAAGAFLIGPPPDKGSSTSAEAVANSEAATVQVIDPVHSRPFDVSVWTPTAAATRNELVVISHGFSGDRTSHSDLAQALVADGYTVAAPTHPDLAGLESDDPTLDPLTLRPRHLSLTIDAMEESADDSFDSVSLVGHSLGGYSALRLAGAQPVLDGAMDAHCETTDDEVLCNDSATGRFQTATSGADNFSDSRVDQVVLLAPGYGPLFGQEALRLQADVLVVAAADDAELPGGQVQALVGKLPGGTESSSVEGGHYVFIRPCSEVEMADVPAICEDPAGVDRSAIHAGLATQIGTFVQG